MVSEELGIVLVTDCDEFYRDHSCAVCCRGPTGIDLRFYQDLDSGRTEAYCSYTSVSRPSQILDTTTDANAADALLSAALSLCPHSLTVIVKCMLQALPSSSPAATSQEELPLISHISCQRARNHDKHAVDPLRYADDSDRLLPVTVLDRLTLDRLTTFNFLDESQEGSFMRD